MAGEASIRGLVELVIASGEGEDPGLGAGASPSPMLQPGGDPSFVAGSPPDTGSETVMDLGAGSVVGPETEAEEDTAYSAFARDFEGLGPSDPTAHIFYDIEDPGSEDAPHPGAASSGSAGLGAGERQGSAGLGAGEHQGPAGRDSGGLSATEWLGVALPANPGARV